MGKIDSPKGGTSHDKRPSAPPRHTTGLPSALCGSRAHTPATAVAWGIPRIWTRIPTSPGRVAPLAPPSRPGMGEHGARAGRGHRARAPEGVRRSGSCAAGPQELDSSTADPHAAAAITRRRRARWGGVGRGRPQRVAARARRPPRASRGASSAGAAAGGEGTRQTRSWGLLRPPRRGVRTARGAVRATTGAAATVAAPPPRFRRGAAGGGGPVGAGSNPAASRAVPPLPSDSRGRPKRLNSKF